MTRTPDEIKKGLECCAASYADCHKECPYKPDCDGSQILKDALALIQQKERENETLTDDLIAERQINKEQLERIQQLEAENAEQVERIKQLEADKQQLEGMLTHMNQLRDAAAGRALKMEERVRQLEAERDAVVETIKQLKRCADCKHATIIDDGAFTWVDCPKRDGRCSAKSLWEWRGVAEEE